MGSMRYTVWIRRRKGRLLGILSATFVYCFLVFLDSIDFFSRAQASSLLNLTRFGFSLLESLLFLTIGCLVWLYARQRRVAQLLFAFALCMMAIFAVETASVFNNQPLLALTGVAGALGLLFFALLLLLFPKNFFASRRELTLNRASHVSYQSLVFQYMLRVYVGGLIILTVTSSLYAIGKSGLNIVTPSWLDAVANSYYVLVLTGIICTILISYFRSSVLRERQQMRLYTMGVLLAFAPLLLLTVLPTALSLPTSLTVDGQLSVLTMVVLPLSLGYSILRYQILVFDRYIRRAVTWIMGSISLAVLGYFVIVVSSLFLDSHPFAAILSMAIALTLLAPFVWWVARMVTERLFFNELRQYMRRLQQPETLTRERFDLAAASNLLTMAAIHAFETQESCLLVLDEETGSYHIALSSEPVPSSSSKNTGKQLLSWVLESIKTGRHTMIDALDAQHPLLSFVEKARRPLLLSEALLYKEEHGAESLPRYLATGTPRRDDPLLAPVRAQGRMIGLLMLGERGDHEPYSGPDFEAMEAILARFAPILETARLYEQASRHVAVLNALYSASTQLEKAYQSIEEVAEAYAEIAAEALQSGAEVWLYSKEQQALLSTVKTGQGPWLPTDAGQPAAPLHPSDWTPWFFEGDGEGSSEGREGPPCLPRIPCYPFAWLPLRRGEHCAGILALTFARPHKFSQEEKRLLSMFATQCMAAMENAQITIALRAAYERQKELDRLKDQFIMTASHELRTPLTAVQGYIELLCQYNETLPPETRVEFMNKAHRGCDELVLMVGNIMDASRVQIDAGKIRLSPVSLADSVQHILEIMEGVSMQEHRTFSVNVPEHFVVMADDLRLRQVLLNLVGNALKYTEEGSRIDIYAREMEEMVALGVRDYGPGVPPEQQGRLFERFVRLERDINSAKRGAGLGLYISKQLIEAMGGWIRVISTGVPGEGSTFIFALQRATAARDARDYASLLARHEL